VSRAALAAAKPRGAGRKTAAPAGPPALPPRQKRARDPEPAPKPAKSLATKSRARGSSKSGGDKKEAGDKPEGGGGASGAANPSPAGPDLSPGASNAELQSLLRRLGGGSFERLFASSAANTAKLESILEGLQKKGDDGAQLQVLSELCELLSMGNEESLGSFSSDAFVPALMALLNADHNPDLMLYACRALTHMMEALPGSRRTVVHSGCIDVLCAKLMTIEYIDLAEQSLQALGKLATDHGRALFRSGGLMAVLSYLDFFPTGVQRSAMQTAAAMCRTAPPECFNMVKEAVPNLTGTFPVSSPPNKLVPHANKLGPHAKLTRRRGLRQGC